MHGYPVGILANQGVLFSESALKATHFIELCAARRIPLVFLQNITGFIVGKRYEQGGIAKDGAKLVNAVANAAVPEVHGTRRQLLRRRQLRHVRARVPAPAPLVMAEQSRISVMGGEQAAQTLLTVKQQQLATTGRSLGEEDADRLTAPIRAKYEPEGSPYYATARLWDDGILDPLETRDALGLALAAAAERPGPAPPRSASSACRSRGAEPRGHPTAMVPSLEQVACAARAWQRSRRVKRVLIANRGEIAVRIARGCRALGHPERRRLLRRRSPGRARRARRRTPCRIGAAAGARAI